MGEVFRARDTRLNRYVAVKVLSPAFTKDPDRLRRFEQEARAAAALNHPAILAIYDIGTEDGAPYIVSELLEGETLRDRLRAGPLPLRTVVNYGAQVARGLAAAHEKGIIHRDLKPENIFITPDGLAKILDFGLAKLLHPEAPSVNGTTETAPDTQTKTGVILGTLGYMSPEQVRGMPSDHRTNVFSLGAVLYEMLTGRRPFKGSTPADTKAAILKEDPPSLTSANANIPPALEQIVLHCLVKEPRGRFQSASDIAFSLETISSVSSSVAKPTPIVEPAESLRWRRVALVAIAIVAAAALGFGVFRFGERSAPATLPRYHRITYQEGIIASAKLSPDGSTILCAARFGKNYEIYSGRLDSTGLRPLGISADQVLSISSRGELSILQSTQTLDGDTEVGSLASVPLGGGAPKRMLNNVQYADWSPDGSELAIAHFIPEKHVYRLEFPIGTVLYETEGWIGHPRFSPDGKTIAFLNHPIFGDDQGFVATISAAGGGPQRLTPSWSSVQGLAWQPDGGEIWFTASAVGPTRSLRAVSRSGAVRPVLNVPASLTLEDIAADGRVLLNYSSERSLVMVSTAAHPDAQDIAWLDDDEFFRFSSDGKQILLGDEGDAAGPRDSTFVRNIDGSSAIRIGDGDGIALSPDNQWALSRVPPDQLWLLPTGPGQARQLLPAGAEQKKVAIRADLPAEWSPDGTRIVFVGDDERTHLLSLDGKDTTLTPVGATGFLMTPDAHYVLVQANGGKYELFPVDGGKPKPLDWPNRNDQPIRFSADGKSLFVVTHDEHLRGRNVYRINFANGRRTLVWHIQSPGNPISNDISYVDVTPDGTAYAYSYRQMSRALYIVEGLK